MINIDLAIKYLEEKSPSTFEEIWSNLKNEFISEFPNFSNEKIKSDLFISLQMSGKVTFEQNEKQEQFLYIKDYFSNPEYVAKNKNIYSKISESEKI